MDLSIDSLPRIDAASQYLKPAGLVLLVSDSPAWIDGARAQLESGGFAIIYADAVESSLSLARHYCPDLIVGDVTMSIEAASLCCSLKESGVTAEIPVLITTRIACDDERIALALEAGADDCLSVECFNRLILKKAENLIAPSRERCARLEAEARYNALAEAVASVVYLIGPEWPFSMLYVSPQARWLGHSCEELEQNPNLWLSLVHTEDRDRVIEELIEACSTGQQHESHYRGMALDGSIRWLCDKRKLILDSADRPVCWEVVSIDITERKEAEETLRLTQFTVDRNADAAFWIRRDGTFLYVNDAACRSLGYEREQLLSMTIHDIDPIYTAEVWPSTWNGVRKGGTFTIETRHRRADGSVFPVEVTARYQEYNGNEYICSFARDITARKQLERAMKQSEQKYRSLFENANNVIIVFDPESDTILEANNRACEIYGFAKKELEGLRLEVISKNLENRRRLVREVLSGGNIGSFKTVHNTKDGVPIDVVGTASLIEYGGGKAVMAILRDVTEIKRLEESLIQSEKLAALGQLVSGVAHELNNPLTSVIGYTQLLQAGAALAGKHSEWLGVIGREAERTRRIVQNLLSFSRQHKPSRTEVDLNDLLEKTLELRAYDLRVNDVEVQRTPGRIPTVNADAHQLQQVFLNIIVNAEHAIKSKRRGKVSILTEPVEVNSKQLARVIISDDGPGISPEHMSKLFDPFFTTKPIGQGTGLGLSISYGIIKEHGGTIRAESSAGAGATFIIEIPVE